MLGPATVVVAGAYTIWLAVSQPDALVVDDYYKQGKAINQDLRRDVTAARLGMQMRLRYNAAEGKLSGEIASDQGPAQQEIRLHLIHPTLPQDDRHFETRSSATGRFEIALPMLELGRWQVQAEDQQKSWRLSGVWSWPQQQQIEIKAEQESAG